MALEPAPILGTQKPKVPQVHCKDCGRLPPTDRRFSEEYFQLVRANKISENQLLSSQRDNEELLILLHRQAYLIK